MAIEDNPGSRTSYGDELKRRREAAGFTQEELSVRAIMSRTHIAHIEAGRRRPSLEDARRLDQVQHGGVFETFCRRRERAASPNTSRRHWSWSVRRR